MGLCGRHAARVSGRAPCLLHASGIGGRIVFAALRPPCFARLAMLARWSRIECLAGYRAIHSSVAQGSVVVKTRSPSILGMSEHDWVQRRDTLVECDFGCSFVDSAEAEAASSGFGSMGPPPGMRAPLSRWTCAELLEVAAVNSHSAVHGGRRRTHRGS